MNDDAALLRRYAEEKSETAFKEVVRRHLDLVYSAALRRTGGNAHTAAEVAQQVFTTLARNAGKLSRHTLLTAWLYTATRNAAIDLLRADQRRRNREHEALLMHELLSDPGANADWQRLRPVLDAAMDELAETDRAAVLLRFFEKRPFGEIGRALRLSEDAARMRVDRALERLRARLAQRGITSTTAALTAVLVGETVVAAPAGMVGAIAGSALVAPAVVAGGTLAGQLAGFMSGTKLSTAIAALAIVAALGGTVYEIRQYQVGADTLALLRQENEAGAARGRTAARTADAAERQTAELQRTLDAARQVATSTPSRPPGGGGRGGGGGGNSGLTGTEEEQMAAGREFLATHPEARAVYDAMRLRAFESSDWAAPLQEMNLSPAERDGIASVWINEMRWRFRVGGGAWAFGHSWSGSNDVFDRALSHQVGEERFRQFEEIRRLAEVKWLAKIVAAATIDTDTPLTPAQASALVQIVDRHRPAPRSNVRSVDWPAATPELEQVLSLLQLTALRAAVDSNAAASRRSL